MLPLQAEWTWEWWQLRGISHSPKLQHYWNLSIRLFSVIIRTLVGGVLPLCRNAVSVFYSPRRLGNQSLLIFDKYFIIALIVLFRRVVKLFWIIWNIVNFYSFFTKISFILISIALFTLVVSIVILNFYYYYYYYYYHHQMKHCQPFFIFDLYIIFILISIAFLIVVLQL